MAVKYWVLIVEFWLKGVILGCQRELNSGYSPCHHHSGCTFTITPTHFFFPPPSRAVIVYCLLYSHHRQHYQTAHCHVGNKSRRVPVWARADVSTMRAAPPQMFEPRLVPNLFTNYFWTAVSRTRLRQERRKQSIYLARFTLAAVLLCVLSDKAVVRGH